MYEASLVEIDSAQKYKATALLEWPIPTEIKSGLARYVEFVEISGIVSLICQENMMSILIPKFTFSRDLPGCIDWPTKLKEEI